MSFQQKLNFTKLIFRRHLLYRSYLSLPISAGVWLLTWLISLFFPPGLSCYGWALVCLNVSSCLEVTLTSPGKTWLCFLSKNWGDNQFLGNKHELICRCLLAHGDKARGSSLCVDNFPASLKPCDNLRGSCACSNHPSVHPVQALSCKTVTAH